MPTRICFVYFWATSGGVERVFLNRSEVLLRRYPELEIEVYFYNDCGGAALFTRYSQARNLSDRLRVMSTFEPTRYDAVFTVDTPQILADHPSILDKVFVECHTAYAENRAYLKDWQSRLATLIVPSHGFQRVIENEYPGLAGKVRVVRNFVPRLPPAGPSLALPAWNAPIFLYFGHIDRHKNFAEFAEGIACSRHYLGKEPLGIVCGQLDRTFPFQKVIERNNVRGSIAVLPPVPFAKSHMLLELLRHKRAVYVSCSKGESFGLSAVEAMTAGLPVVLSRIPAHAAIVAGREKFLYGPGDTRDLAMKMAAAIEHYDELSSECLELAREFSEEAFLEDWEQVFAPHMKTALGAA